MNDFSDNVTQGLADAFTGLTGRVPTAEEFRGRLNDVASGARTLFDQLSDIAKSPEAQSFAQKTGLDPNQYVLNDIYRLGLNRDVDAPSAATQMEVLRNQGGQNLYNQVANSQEGRTYALNNFYGNAFGHDLDQGVLNSYLSQLASGKTLQAVEAQILQSPEAQSQPASVREQLANLITPSFLTPTIGFTGSQTGTLGAGPDIGTIGASGLTPTVGAGQDTPTINDWYNAYVQRAPDPTGLASYEGQITNGVPANLVQAQILASPEAAGTLGPDRLTQLVNDYQTQYGIKPQDAATLAPLASDFAQLVGRPADTPTLQHWDQQIQSGMPLGAVEAQIIAAPEAQQARTASLDGISSAFQAKYGLLPTEAATLSPSSADYAKLLGPGANVGTIGAGPNTPTPNTGSFSPAINNWYEGILQRAPDAQGAQGYQDQLTAGVAPNLIEAQILNSGEAAQTLGPDRLSKLIDDYQTTYGISPQATSTLAPLSSDYARIVGRGMDVPTQQWAAQQLQSGTPEALIEAQIIGAPEAIQAHDGNLSDINSQYQAKYGLTPSQVQTLSPLASEFQQATGRGVDTPTLQWWQSQTNDGVPQSVLEAQLLQSAEVQARGPDALAPLVNDYQTQYGLKPQEVATLGPLASEFAKATGRGVDTPTLQYWDQQIDAGNGTPGLSAQILTSPEVMARTGGQGDLYTDFQNQYGRSASDYLAGLTNPTGFTGANTSGGVGNGTWSGTFDPSQYLAANPDVAAAHVDPLTHYLTYGFNENRALDTAGDRINQGFDPNAYLAQNPDVAASKMDPLAHYLEYGAHEGRAAPTGDNPYSFSNFNVGQSLGAGNGSFGLNGITGGGSPTGITTAPGPSNALDGSGGASGSAFGYTADNGNPAIATFNPQASEQSYLAGQVNQNNQMIAAGQSSTANNPNAANLNLANLGAQVSAQQINGVNPAILGAATGVGGGISNVGTYVAPGSNLPNPIVNIPAPVLPGGLNAIAGFGGPLNGAVSFGGHGGFF